MHNLTPVDWKARHALRQPKVHELKVWPEFFIPLKARLKMFELRKADRDYCVGDTLRLKEYDPVTDTYTGDVVSHTITFIIKEGPWLVEGYLCLGLK